MLLVQFPDDDTYAVVVGRAAEATVSLGPPVRAGDTSRMSVPVRVSATGLSVQTMMEVEDWAGGPIALVDFLDDLAASWRGWAGVKGWSDDGKNMTVAATHDGVGLVTLVVSMSPFYGLHLAGSWEVQVVVPVEPGSLAPLAERVRALLLGEAPR